MSLFVGRHLSDLDQAFYEEQSEATCRITIDIILIQCRKYIREKYFPTKADPAFLTAPSTPAKDAFGLLAETPRRPTKMYPESTISVEVPSRSAPHKKFLVSGRADWVLGYSPKDEDGALLVALEAKQRSEFSSVESQLIAYLAILRENRRKAGKTNIITQGFYSDGRRFAFVYITEDGTVEQSSCWDITAEGGLSMVFSFIVAMLETAVKSTPTATPTKPGKQQDKEIQDFEDEVWSKYYKLRDESLRVDNDSDHDMDNTIEISEVF